MARKKIKRTAAAPIRTPEMVDLHTALAEITAAASAATVAAMGRALRPSMALPSTVTHGERVH